MKKHLALTEELSHFAPEELDHASRVISRPSPVPDLAMRGRGRATGPPRPVFKPPSLAPGRGRAGKASEEKEEKKEEQKQTSRRPTQRAPVKKPQMSANPFGGPPAPQPPAKEEGEEQKPAGEVQPELENKDKIIASEPEQTTTVLPQTSPSEEVREAPVDQKQTPELPTPMPQPQPKPQPARIPKIEVKPQTLAPAQTARAPPTTKISEPEKPEQKIEKPKEAPKPMKPAAANPGAAKPAAGSEAKKEGEGQEKGGGLFSMITGYLGILNMRKQAYTGKPASAMFYDEKKGRYVIMGEEESDDDEPPPPPPGLRRAAADSCQADEGKQESKKEEAPQVSGLNALTSVGFAGALANKGRGRGRGRTTTRPQTSMGGAFNPAAQRQPPAEVPVQKEEVKLAESQPREELQPRSELLYQTALDQTLTKEPLKPREGRQPNQLEVNKTVISQPRAQSRIEVRRGEAMSLNESVALPQSKPISNQGYLDRAREQQWLAKFQKMSLKIQNYKLKIQRYQAELVRQRDENEQTIENFTTLCQELKFRAMDEVEELTAHTRALQQALGQANLARADHEHALSQQQRAISDLRAENDRLQTKLESTSLSAAQTSEMTDHQGLESRLQTALAYGGLSEEQAGWKQQNLTEVLDLKCENESLRWKLSILQVDSAHLVQELLKAFSKQDQHEAAQSHLKDLEAELDQQRQEVKRVRQEQASQSHDQQRQDNEELAQLHLLVGKLQQEKEANQEAQRERQRDWDSKLKDLQAKNSLLEQTLKQTQVVLKKSQTRETGEEVRVSSQELVQAQSNLQSREIECADLHRKLAKVAAECDALRKGSSAEQDDKAGFWKEQVSHLEEMLKAKEETINQLGAASLEARTAVDEEDLQKQNSALKIQLQHQEQVSVKLNEHVVYLQNEVKKREELLDTSDFFDNEDFESSLDDEDEEADSDDHSDKIHSLNDSEEQEQLRAMKGSMVIESPGLDLGEKRVVETPSGSKFSAKTKDIVENQIRAQLDRVNDNLQQRKERQQKKKTVQSILREQLEDLRTRLQREIEAKVKLERQLASSGRRNDSLEQGLRDIDSVLQDALPKLQGALFSQDELSEDGSQSDETFDEDAFVQAAIAKVFGLQRHFQSRVADQEHALSMKDLQLDDLQSLRLDLDILSQEKALSDAVHNSLRRQLDAAHAQLSDKDSQAQDSELQLRAAREKLSSVQAKLDSLERATQEQIEDMRARCSERVQDAERRIDRRAQDVKEFYENVVMAEIKGSAERRIQAVQSELKKVKDELSEETERFNAAKSELATSERQLVELKRESQNEVDQLQREIRHSKGMVELRELEQKNQVQKLELECSQKVEAAKRELATLEDQFRAQREQMLESTKQIKNEVSEYELRCQDLIEQRDGYKAQVKQLRAGQEELEESHAGILSQLEALEQEKQDMEAALEQAKEQASKREDETFWKLVNQVNELKAQEKVRAEEVEFAKKSQAGAETLQQALNEERALREQERQEKEEAQEALRTLEQTQDNSQSQQEFQTLLDYQLKINDGLNLKNESLQDTISTLRADLASHKQAPPPEDLSALHAQVEALKTELEAKSEQLLEAQFKQELGKAEAEFEADPSEDKELAKQLAEARAQIAKLELRQGQYEKGAEEMALKFKEKLKKQKDELKKAKDAEGKLAEQIGSLSKERDEARAQLEAIRDQKQGLMDQLNSSKLFSFQADLPEESMLSALRQDLSALGSLEADQSRFKEALLNCFKNAGIEGVEDVEQWKHKPVGDVLEKLEELLQNYLEDQRQINNLLEANQELTDKNQTLENQNYDLRYELQEEGKRLEAAQTELSAAKADSEKLVGSDAGKLALKIKVMEEESRELKAGLVQQIQMKDSELETMRSQLAIQMDSSFDLPAGSAEAPTSRREVAGAYQDLSVNQDLKSEPKTKHKAQPAPSKHSSRQDPNKNEVEAAKQAVQGGLFNSIASFFLTESEMGQESRNMTRKERPPTQTGTQEDNLTEYEYYSYDEEDDDQAHSFMKENLE